MATLFTLLSIERLQAIRESAKEPNYETARNMRGSVLTVNRYLGRPPTISNVAISKRFKSLLHCGTTKTYVARFFSCQSEAFLLQGPLTQIYYDLICKQDVLPDPHQLQALQILEALRFDLVQMNPTEPPTISCVNDKKTSFFASFFGTDTTKQKQPTIKGTYLFGGVGCGKTFLLNLFYNSLADTAWHAHCQKIHFHTFMLHVHEQMHNSQKQPHANDVLGSLVTSTLAQGRLICIDEFQVTDVADAMILQRLFTGLWQQGAIVVATSNRAPHELYWNGIQRDRFVPFITTITKYCEIVSMRESDTDYRLLQASKGTQQDVYFVGADGQKQLDTLFYDIVGSAAVAPTTVTTQNRKIQIPQAVLSKSVARFSFEDVCQKAMGAADYLQIGQHFHTVFVDKIPVLTMNELNWVRRFITFVDSMYESNVALILHAKTDKAELFVRPSGDETHDEVFAFDRTLSRLEEMSSQTYLQKRWVGKGKGSGDVGTTLFDTKVLSDVQATLGDETETSQPKGITFSAESMTRRRASSKPKRA
jgi:protein AFG1